MYLISIFLNILHPSFSVVYWSFILQLEVGLIIVNTHYYLGWVYWKVMHMTIVLHARACIHLSSHGSHEFEKFFMASMKKVKTTNCVHFVNLL